MYRSTKIGYMAFYWQPLSFSPQLKRNNNAKCKKHTCTTRQDKHHKWGMEQNAKWCPFCHLLRHACCCHICSTRWNGRCVNHGTAVVHTPIKPHGVSQAKWFPFQTLFSSKKNTGFGTTTIQPAAILRIEESSLSSLILVASYDMPKRKAEVTFCTGEYKSTNLSIC